jgi:nickel transport protein
MIAFCLAAIQAQAHKVNVFGYVDGDRLVVEGYFSASVKARDCTVEVFDEGGKKIHEGKTDQKGIYSFNLADLPALSGGLRFVLDVGEGHKAEYNLNAADLPGAMKRDPAPKKQPREDKLANASGLTVTDSTQAVDQAALMAAVETVLDKKLEPIVRMLGKQERLFLEQMHGGPRMTEIVGGIGWIMGLVGLAAFFWGRNRSARKSFD